MLHGVNRYGIPRECPHCGAKPPKDRDVIETKVVNYVMSLQCGDVVCATCGGYIREYDAS